MYEDRWNTKYVYARTDCSVRTTDLVQATLPCQIPKNVPTIPERKEEGVKGRGVKRS
jgi:hypothetical protein